MSSFTALNLSDDELDIEEHTRELQIEIALNTLNKALEFQKNNQFDKAHLKYDELGRIEILQQPNISNNPTINRLKYLYCRNRGMLRLREMIDQHKLKKEKDEKKKIEDQLEKQIKEPKKIAAVDADGVIDVDMLEDDSESDSDDTDDDDLEVSIYGEIIGSINDLLNATVYGEPDVKIIQVLASLFNHFGHPRLARLCYELKLSNNEDILKINDDLKIDLERPEDLLVNQINLLDNFLDLLNEISDNRSTLYKKVQKCLNSRNFWGDIKKNDKHSKYNWSEILTKEEWDHERFREPDTLLIDVVVVDNLVDLGLFMEDVVNCVPKPKGKHRILDGYHLTKNIFERVEFEFEIQESSEKKQVDNEDNEDEMIRFDSEEDKTEVTGDIMEIVDDKVSDSKDDMKASDSKDESKSKDVIANRAMRSARSKPEPETNGQAKTKLKNYDIFISQTLPSFIQLCGTQVSYPPLSKLVLNETITSPININVAKFYSCIADWNDEYTQCLSVTDNKRKGKSEAPAMSENESIREILNLKSSKVIHQHSYKRKDLTKFASYLQKLSDKNLHFDQIRFAIVKFMFEADPLTGSSIICVEPLTKKTMKNFKHIVDCVSIHFFNEFEHFIFYDIDATTDKELIINKFNTSVTIFEILVDTYLEFNQEQKLKKTSSYKNTLADIQNLENTITNRIEKWLALIEDAFSLKEYNSTLPDLDIIWARFVWFKIYYLQTHSNTFDPQGVSYILSDLSLMVRKHRLYLPYVNFELIPILNYENVQTQFSKLKILEIFDKNEESNVILEAVLLKKQTAYKDDEDKKRIQTQFEKFIETSNLPLKLRLWSLLLRYYRLNSDIFKYRIAFEHIVELMIDELNPDNINKLPEHQSKITILNVIGFFCYFSQNFIHFCDSMKFDCFTKDDDRESSAKMVKNVSVLLYMLYSFLMYQNAVQIDGRVSLSVKSSKSFEILNDCISNCFFLLSFYFPSALVTPRAEHINDFLSICHIELGFLHMCSSIDGTFLKYLQHKLTTLDFDISANDVFQIIHCRFGLSISLDGFETFDHKCKPKKMTEEDAIQLSKFVSIYCFKGKHPVISPPRNDVKNIIDKIVDVFSDPRIGNSIVNKNKAILDRFLNNTNIDLQFVIDIFHGKFELAFEKPKLKGIQVAENGLYYIEGLIGLHFFKVRKRTMQSRAAELDYVLTMLENDVLCGCNRFETWVALGQTYTFLVEDDLVWTADKLNSVEKKQTTALTQKKALLCYFIAISLHLKSSDEEKKRHESIVPILWESFAKELYGAWMEPMNKKAFHIALDEDIEKTKTFSTDSSKFTTFKARKNDIPSNAIYKLLELSFKLAAENTENDWYDKMYLAKSQCKLINQYIDPNMILNNFLSACAVAYEQSPRDDPIIEPHYYLYSAITKFYKASKITLDEAIGFFKRDELFAQLFIEDFPTDSFNNLTFKMLYKMINYDKKNWQHRPVYRLAQAYYYLNHDLDKTEKELLTLINLKPNIRSLSAIWKPTSERPGKHFIYNSVYTQFLVQILYETGDIYSLTVLLKKMRRAGSIMVNLTKTFDNMTLRICILIKKSLNLVPNFLDISLSNIKYADFLKYSTEFIEFMKVMPTDQFDEDPLLNLFFLSETQTFRKLATGFGATGLIDECYHSIYVQLFLPFLFKRLVQDKNGGVLNKELLETAKDFNYDKSGRSKQTTPDVSSRFSYVGNDTEAGDISGRTTPSNAKLQGDDQNFDSDDELQEGLGSIDGVRLTMIESYLIINYLSFGKSDILGTPGKEKFKVARRDVSPFALKLATVTQNLINELKENTNDGEAIDYNIKGPLDNSEFEKAIVGVMVKETKENKEDKEFEELISAHDRLFNNEELAQFNEILEKFNVDKLCNTNEGPPAIISRQLEDRVIEKIPKENVSTSIVVNNIGNNDVPVSVEPTVEQSVPLLLIASGESTSDTNDNSIVIFPESHDNVVVDNGFVANNGELMNVDEPAPIETQDEGVDDSKIVEEIKIVRESEKVKNVEIQDNEMVDVQDDSKADLEVGAKADLEVDGNADIQDYAKTNIKNDVNVIIHNNQKELQSKENNKIPHEETFEGFVEEGNIPNNIDVEKSNYVVTKEVTVVASLEKEDNPFQSPKKEKKGVTLNEEVHVEEHAKDKIADEPVNHTETLGNDESHEKIEKVTPVKVKHMFKKVDDITPSKSTQSVITNFFKVSPNKVPVAPQNKITLSSLNKMIENKRIAEEEVQRNDGAIKRRKPSNVESSDIEEIDIGNKKVNETNSPSRRHSTRGLGHVKLLELGKGGSAKEQVNIKLQRQNQMLAEAEVLSSSDESDTRSVIVIE